MLEKYHCPLPLFAMITGYWNTLAYAMRATRVSSRLHIQQAVVFRLLIRGLHSEKIAVFSKLPSERRANINWFSELYIWSGWRINGFFDSFSCETLSNTCMRCYRRAERCKTCSTCIKGQSLLAPSILRALRWAQTSISTSCLQA
jgi:hypothetical protein